MADDKMYHFQVPVLIVRNSQKK